MHRGLLEVKRVVPHQEVVVLDAPVHGLQTADRSLHLTMRKVCTKLEGILRALVSA